MNKLYKFSNKLKGKNEIIIILLILSIPFLFYLYTIVPENLQVWKTKWFTIDSGRHQQVEYYIWILAVKFLTLGLLSFWFITCKHRWRWVLIFPFISECYKVFCIINFTKFDNTGRVLGYTITISILYIFILIVISNKLGYYKRKMTSSELLNEEINQQLQQLSKFDLKTYKSYRKDLRSLHNQKPTLDKKEYLLRLIALRDRFVLQ